MWIQDCNVSEVDMTLWQDLISNMSLWFRALMFITFIAVILLGGILTAGLISFEINGGDPQKRGLANQLISMSSGQCWLMYAIGIPVISWQYFVGPISEFCYWIWWFALNSFAVQAGVNFFSSVVLRYLTIVVYERMLSIEDNFMALFMFINSIILGSISSMIHCLCKVSFTSGNAGRFLELPPEIVLVRQRSFPFETSHHLIIVPAAMLYIFASVRMAYKSFQSDKDDFVPIPQNESSRNSMNILSHNQDVVNMASLMIIGGISVLLIVVIPMTLTSDNEQSLNTFDLLKGETIPPFILTVVVPSLIFQRNAELRKYCRELLAL